MAKKYSFSFNVAINERATARVNETVSLGVLLDENLTRKSLVSSLANKISKSIGIVFRSSFFLSKLFLRMLYNSILLYLSYCNLV